MAARLKLISHKLCPYVQRAVIALNEKGVAFERIDIDLANKPDWFLKVSPLGKVPVLSVKTDGGEVALFESNVICEYIEDTQGGSRLHPQDPLQRAQHRAWMEFGHSERIMGSRNNNGCCDIREQTGGDCCEVRARRGGLGLRPVLRRRKLQPGGRGVCADISLFRLV